MKRFSGFDELASEIFPELKLEKPPTPEVDEDLVSKIRRLRIDQNNFPGLLPHRGELSTQEPLVEPMRTVADQLYEARFTEQWDTANPDGISSALQSCAAAVEQLADRESFHITSPGIYTFIVDRSDFPELPNDYAFKGGVARKALARVLNLHAETGHVRDMDVLHFGSKPDPETDKTICMSIMIDDFVASGKLKENIELLKSEKKYFQSRDLTVNQVVLIGERLICTAQCIADTIGNTVRPTLTHLGKNGRADWIIAAKAVRFDLFGRSEGRNMRLMQFKTPNVAKGNSRYAYHANRAIVVHLFRCLESSVELGVQFADEVRKRGWMNVKLSDDKSKLRRTIENLCNQYNLSQPTF